MLVGYSIPTTPAYSLAGTGADWLSDVRLGTGFPGIKTRFSWLSEASPTIADYVDFRVLWPIAQPIGIVGLFGLSLPEGCKVEVTGRRAVDGAWTHALGGNALTQTVVTRSDGRRRLLVIPTATDELVGLQWRIYNDLAGEVWADAATVVDVEEAVGMRAAVLAIDSAWQDELVSASRVEFTLAGRPNRTAWRDRRVRQCSLVPADVAEARAQGLSGSTDWARLDAAMSGFAPVLTVPRYVDAAGSLDSGELHETAMLGVAIQRGGTRHLSGPWYDRQGLRFEEAAEA